jgi:type I restriction-modification system DNA methylase subunit
MAKPKKSEVHAYVHIIDELTKKKGWNKKQIYTQGECHENNEIKKYLGLTKPENVVKINENMFYVIEAKNERKKLDLAMKEAREDYADKINKSDRIKSLFATGIAGNDQEGFIAKSQFFHNGTWELITENNIEVTGLLSKNQIEEILRTNSPSILDIEISDQEFLKVAENINEILHKNSINKDYRARFISTILLAMSDGKDLPINDETMVLITTINKRAELILNRHKKSSFSRFIKIDEPSNEDNHKKVKKAIIKTYEELLGLNIRSAMRSGKDVLGKFYEVFLKYGNGAKEIGIVLTPRHITQFAANILDVSENDLVLDPACGTGGFLVASYDEVKKKIKNEKDFTKFRNCRLFGIEDQDPIISLAIVNMIFRGDGNSNMIEGDCFQKWLNLKIEKGYVSAEYLSNDEENRIPPITKVLMNPPFARPESNDKEYRFIEHALEQMSDEGLLFSVLPISVMFEGGEEKAWRRNKLLNENTLLSVVTFPPELFYPTGVHTLGVIIKKGIPHDKNQNVLWVRAVRDGFRKLKGKRLRYSDEPDDFAVITPLLKEYIKNQSMEIKSVPLVYKAAPIDYNDELMELVPEVYVDSFEMSEDEIIAEVDIRVRETVAHIIKSRREQYEN